MSALTPPTGIESAPATTPHRSSDSPVLLQFRGVTKTYGRTRVLDGLDLDIPTGQFVVIYGPPASGKSVLMRLLMGLEQPDSGTLVLRGEDITRDPPADRNIGYIPQSFALYPHQSVHDNIAYPLKLAKAPKASIEPIVQRAAAMLAITEQLPKRPEQLSGGQKQRVAIARGLAKQTDLYVFDDPLAGLDFKLREQLVDDLRSLRLQTGATFLYTTSDALEALTLADQLAVLDAGRVVDIGPPERIYREPANVRAMALLGFPRANLLSGQLSATARQLQVTTSLFDVPLAPMPGGGASTGDAVIGIRPEDILVAHDAAPPFHADHPRLQAKVLLREDLGGEEIVYLDAGGVALTSVLRHAGAEIILPDIVEISIRPSDIMVFSPGSGMSLGRGADSNTRLHPNGVAAHITGAPRHG